MKKITLDKILRHIGFRIIRVICRLLFIESGGFRGPFGSYISPRSQVAANDYELYEILRPIMDLMTTHRVDKPLMRLGSEFDGGYVIINQDYSRSFLIAAGISNNNDFEKSFADLGGHGHQVDYTVEDAPFKHDNLTFSPSRLVGEHQEQETFDVTLDALFMNHIKDTQFEGQANILKMDIEGSEWEILNSSKVLNRFDQILIEIHYLERFAIEEYHPVYVSALTKLFSHFAPVAIAGNNCCGFVTIGGFSVPRVLEMTLVNRDNYDVKLEDDAVNMGPLITRNYSNRAPISLKRW